MQGGFNFPPKHRLLFLYNSHCNYLDSKMDSEYMLVVHDDDLQPKEIKLKINLISSTIRKNSLCRSMVPRKRGPWVWGPADKPATVCMARLKKGYDRRRTDKDRSQGKLLQLVIANSTKKTHAVIRDKLMAILIYSSVQLLLQ